MKSKPHLAAALLLAVILLSLFLAQGCSLTGQGNPLAPTLTAMTNSIAVTLTAAKQQDTTTQLQATAETAATAAVQVVQSTQTAEVEVQEQNAQATEAVAAPVLSELAQYGLDPSSGQLGWLHDPLELQLTGHHEYKFGNDHMNVTAADFALASDITWDTQYGGSGCGFMFRSNGDQNSPDAYMVLATRFASGHIVFLALKDGELANFHDFYPRDEDKSFQIENGSTNRLAIVARGNLIDIYSNGVNIGQVDTTKAPYRPPLPAAPKAPDDLKDIPLVQKYQKLKQEYDAIAGQINSQYALATKNFKSGQSTFTDGFLAMAALSESGKTTCTFEDAWLWLLQP